jgi:hypothetical protein
MAFIGQAAAQHPARKLFIFCSLGDAIETPYERCHGYQSADFRMPATTAAPNSVLGNAKAGLRGQRRSTSMTSVAVLLISISTRSGCQGGISGNPIPSFLLELRTKAASLPMCRPKAPCDALVHERLGRGICPPGWGSADSSGGGMPKLVIQFRTLHPIFASVRCVGRVRA